MCKYCENLMDVPKNRKSVSVIHEKEVNGEKSTVEMVLDHHEDGTPYAFIHSELSIDGRWFNIPFHISCCPFCGRKLLSYGG